MTAVTGNGATVRADEDLTLPGGPRRPGPDPAEVYALGADAGEQARLIRQSGELRPEAEALLARFGLGPGDAALDLGCGPRGILDLLAAAVSPGGRVVGLDADPGHVAAAAARYARSGPAAVQVIRGDARRTGLPAGSFDLVHARTLLVTIPGPDEVLGEMVRLAPRAAGSPARSPTSSTHSATRRCPPGTGSGRSSAPPSPGQAPTCISAAGWPRCTGRPGWWTFRYRCMPAPIPWAIPAGPSSPTWCAACAR